MRAQGITVETPGVDDDVPVLEPLADRRVIDGLGQTPK